MEHNRVIKDDNKMKIKAFAATLAVVLTVNVKADSVGLYLGGQVWQSDASGTFGEKNSPVDFNLEKEQQINYFIAVEHPVPLLPNLRISSATFDTTGKNTLTQPFKFNDETFAAGDDISASYNVSYIDYSLYYELFDNDKFSFDLGLSARDFNGDVTVTGPTVTLGDCDPSVPDNPCTLPTSSYTPVEKIKTDDIVAMLYVATNIGLPFTGLSVFGQGDFSLVGDHSLYDYQVGLNYELIKSIKGDINLSVGYQVVEMELKDLNSLFTDIKFKGAFVGVSAHF